MTYHFKNLVFEGGGVKGIAYVGAMEVLENLGILGDIQRAGGTSAGAINALLFGLNYTPNETKRILKKLNFKNFLDDDWGVIRDTKRLFEKYGVYKGDFFRKWVGKLIEAKTGNPDSTFNDLAAMRQQKGFRDVYFAGTNLSTGFSEVFSMEHTPRMPVADAVRISMSIPLFFASVRNFRDDVYVDGGVLDNYPIKLFDRAKYLSDSSSGVKTEYYAAENAKLKRKRRKNSAYVFNTETLGFRLDSKEEIAVFRDQAEPKHHEIDSFLDYLVRLIGTMMEFQSSMHLHSDDWRRTIYVDTLGVKTTDFGLSGARKEALVKSGRESTKSYFNWLDKENAGS